MFSASVRLFGQKTVLKKRLFQNGGWISMDSPKSRRNIILMILTVASRKWRSEGAPTTDEPMVIRPFPYLLLSIRWCKRLKKKL